MQTMSEAEIHEALDTLINQKRKRNVKVAVHEIRTVKRTFNPRDPQVEAQKNYWANQWAQIGVIAVEEVK